VTGTDLDRLAGDPIRRLSNDAVERARSVSASAASTRRTRSGRTASLRAVTLEASWSVVAPVLDVWRALPPRAFPNYAAGSWGPQEADPLLERDERTWRTAGA
jgi:glucose-6-phosphate dehydrogenase-like protein